MSIAALSLGARRLPYGYGQEARSIAKTAVSGSLIGSRPILLTNEVTVPSDSASTQARNPTRLQHIREASEWFPTADAA